MSFLPPLYVSAFGSAGKIRLVPAIHKILGSMDESSITILTLFQKCNSLNVGGFLLGSARGRHKSASLVLAYPVNNTTGRWKLTKIYYFAKCSRKVVLKLLPLLG